MKRTSKLWMWIVASAAAGCAGGAETSTEQDLASPCDYPQAFGTGDHGGTACPEVTGLRVVARLEQDPDADAENRDRGFLQVHESPPLTSGDFVIVPGKSGYTSIFDQSTTRWDVRAYRWSPSVTSPGATLAPIWTQKASWQPVDAIVSPTAYTNFYVPMFAPAIANASVYMPERFGRVRRINLATGATVAVIDPFAGTPFSGDEFTITTNALSVDAGGNVYYAVTAFPLNADARFPTRAAWLVKVHPDNTTQIAEWETIASPSVGVAAERDLCEYPFGTLGTPFPTGPDSRAPRFECGRQRPMMNAPFAHTGDGKIVVGTAANNADRAAFLVTVDAATLAPISAADLRGHLLTGCGSRLALSRSFCRQITNNGTTNIGNHPSFNSPVALTGWDIMDGAPVAYPDGTIGISGYDGGFTFGGGFDSRGSSLRFTRGGSLVAKNTEFGFEVTPSIFRHAGGFSLLQDRNLYSDFELTTARYSPSGVPELVGEIPLSFDPVAIDWLDAHIPFGPDGEWYAVNGDGHLYKFAANGKLSEIVALTNPDGTVREMEGLASYFARDRVGRIYVSFAGYVYVIAGGSSVITPRQPTPSAELLAARAVKGAAADLPSKEPAPAQ
jgi:hypothetical protein